MRWKLIDRATGAHGAAIDWRFRVGDQVKIRLVNEMDSDHPMQHPFHVHGAGRFLILARDVTISGLREGLALSGRPLPVGPGGKLKTVAVMIGAGTALTAQTLAYAQLDLGWLTGVAYVARGALWAGVALALWSGWDYVRAAMTRRE